VGGIVVRQQGAGWRDAQGIVKRLTHT
jgi:hypothetical protein